MHNRWFLGSAALVAGMALNFLGDWLTGGQIETFRGIETFNIGWAADVFLVPFMVGLLVAKIFGKHAKWLACLPPLFVRSLSYVYLYFEHYASNPNVDFYLNLHLHYWGLCVILAVESANLGAILGEVLVGVYGRTGPMNRKVNAPAEMAGGATEAALSKD